jgi:hypothetical protein
MYVSVHNPSSLNMYSAEFSVPENMNFNVTYFNTSDQLFVPVYTEQVCDADHLDSGKNITNCKLKV